VNDAFTTPYDTPITKTVLTNDSSPDGVLTPVTLVSDVSHGTLALNPDGTFTYTADPGFTGTDSFVYQASIVPPYFLTAYWLLLFQSF